MMKPLFKRALSWKDVPDLRILFSGDRNWSDRDIVIAHFQKIIQHRKFLIPNFTVIEGEADGLDTIAREVAEMYSIPVLKFPADWEKYSLGAGPIRNKQMITEGRPHMVMAYHPNIKRSRGTGNMVAQAKDAGLPYVVFDAHGNPSCDWLDLKVFV